MNSIRRISSYLAFITIGIVALTYSLQISLFFALLVIMTGVLWYRQGYKHLLALHSGFIIFCLLISFAVLQYGINLWLIMAMHTTLALWDLLAFNTRLDNSDTTQGYRTIAKLHIDRLSFALTLSLGLSLLTLYIKANLSLFGIILCGLIVMISISSAIKLLQRDSA